VIVIEKKDKKKEEAPTKTAIVRNTDARPTTALVEQKVEDVITRAAPA
jgi:hypothetical protein